MLKVQTDGCFRSLLTFSLLTGKKLQLSREKPLYPEELTFLEFLDNVSLGTKAILNKNKTKINFFPGKIKTILFTHHPL
jgi:RNA 3'-terminal phosphate cyclase